MEQWSNGAMEQVSGEWWSESSGAGSGGTRSKRAVRGSVGAVELQAYGIIFIAIIELYHPLDGITSLRYKLLLLCFLTPTKKFF
jgi:hypothetical protein